MGGSTGEMLASFIAGAKNWRRAPFYMTDVKLLIGSQINATLRSLKREDAPFLGVGCAWTSRSLGLYFSCAWGKDRADHVGNLILGEAPASVISWRQGSVLIFANPRS